MSSPESLPLIPQARVHALQLAHDETKYLNLSEGPISSPREVQTEFGLAVPLLARIKAGNHPFAILDTRHSDQIASPMLLVDSSFKDSETGYKGVWPGEPTTFGRDHYADRFDYDRTVSRTHFSVAFDGLKLVVKNHQPLNKTLLDGNITDAFQSRKRRSGIISEFTKMAEDDIRDRHDFGAADEFAPHGYFMNHRIIGRRTPGVRDGVYFTNNSEVVLVDDKSSLIKATVSEFMDEFNRVYGSSPTVFPRQVLQMVNKFTQTKMDYNLRRTEKLSRPHFNNHGIITLSEYVREGVGVCRHQCLLAALILEELVDQQKLWGKPRVERNEDTEVNGAHAWAVFDGLGEPYVIDPAQDFVGTKEEARRQGRWKYELSE